MHGLKIKLIYSLLKKSIILVCDTGQKSRVAASVLIDEGFSKLVSLKRGMRRWHRWEMLKLNCQKKSSVGSYFCGVLG